MCGRNTPELLQSTGTQQSPLRDKKEKLPTIFSTALLSERARQRDQGDSVSRKRRDQNTKVQLTQLLTQFWNKFFFLFLFFFLLQLQLMDADTLFTE